MPQASLPAGGSSPSFFSLLLTSSLVDSPLNDSSKPNVRPLSGKAPRAPKKGNEIAPSSLQPHVPTKDRLLAWSSPHALSFDSELAARFLIEFCKNYFCVLSAAIDTPTKETYSAGVLRFTQFCDLHKVSEKERMPTSAVLLSAFLSHYAGRVSGSAIKNWMSGLAMWHCLSGAQWFGDEGLVSKMKRGAIRMAPISTRREPRPPASLEHILTLLRCLTLSNLFDIVVAVVAVCAFLACCRLGELTVPSRDGFAASHHVSRSAIDSSSYKVSRMSFGDRTSVITELPIPWTKTMKEMGAILNVMDTTALPFSELFLKHLQINDGAPKSGHLFAYKDQDGMFVPPTKSTFLNQCYEIWKENNMLLPAGHSFRIEGTTEWLLAGVPPETVAKIGRWTSLAFLLYWRRVSEVISRSVSSSYDTLHLSKISDAFTNFCRNVCRIPDNVTILQSE